MDPAARSRPASPWRLLGHGADRWLSLPLLEAVPGLGHAITVLGSDPDAVRRGMLGADSVLCALRQVHGNTVRRFDRAPEPGSQPGDGDGLVTDRPGLALGVWTADCVPILICDETTRAVAAVHAGWRGTVAGVLARTIEALMAGFACRPETLRVALGPAIGRCCFEVGDEVVEALLRADPGAGGCVTPGGRARVDLLGANRRQAAAAGVPPERIEATGLCTACRGDLLPSYRRSGGSAGRIASLIGWRS